MPSRLIDEMFQILNAMFFYCKRGGSAGPHHGGGSAGPHQRLADTIISSLKLIVH